MLKSVYVYIFCIYIFILIFRQLAQHSEWPSELVASHGKAGMKDTTKNSQHYHDTRRCNSRAYSYRSSGVETSGALHTTCSLYVSCLSGILFYLNIANKNTENEGSQWNKRNKYIELGFV